MQAIAPLVVSDANLTSSNIPENDHPQWSSLATYALGDRVISLVTHKIYESAANSNTGNDPATGNGTFWIEVSATNKYKAFDGKLSDPATQADSIEYVINTGSNIINSMALFRLFADTARVVVEDNASNVVYDETYTLLDNSSVIDWYTYFFEPTSERLEQLLINDIPFYTNATITITLENIGSTVEAGQVVLGQLTSLGRTAYGTEIGIEDFSRKDRDVFGNAIIIERAFAQTADYEVEIDTKDARRVQKFLAKYRTTPLVWIGQEDDAYGLIVYGFYTQFSINLATPSISYTTIEVEGLT